MTRKCIILCLVSTTFYLYSREVFSQEPLQIAEAPTGFMIEGILAQQLFAIGYNQLSPTFPAAAGVPHAVLGFKLRAVAIGLGIGFYRFATHRKDNDGKTKKYYTSMLFSPRFEITVYRSRRGIAEAYIALSFGAGFHHMKDKDPDNEDSAVDVVLGGHAAMGARVFLGGSPFALGAEFGWTGTFMHLGEDFIGTDQSNWLNTSGAYGALIGQFVFN